MYYSINLLVGDQWEESKSAMKNLGFGDDEDDDRVAVAAVVVGIHRRKERRKI